MSLYQILFNYDNIYLRSNQCITFPSSKQNKAMKINKIVDTQSRYKDIGCKLIITIYYFQGVWNLNAQKGKNIQLHFQDFELESINDVVEVRDGGEVDSLLLGKTEI